MEARSHLNETHNLGISRARTGCPNGVAVQFIEQSVMPGRAWHQISSDHGLLSVVLSEVGGRCETRVDVDRPDRSWTRQRHQNGHLSLVPAGMPVWGYSDNIQRVDELRFSLEPNALEAIMDDELPAHLCTEPRLMFMDEVLQGLARLLARTLGSDPLLEDCLVAAMAARIARLGRSVSDPRRKLGLSREQLASVTDYILADLSARIRLSQLAEIAHLSQSQFGRAFKVSTGLTPHAWQLNARIDRAKALISERRHPLSEVALATGFSEQSHFNRVFKARVGMTPVQWRASVTH